MAKNTEPKEPSIEDRLTAVEEELLAVKKQLRGHTHDAHNAGLAVLNEEPAPVVEETPAPAAQEEQEVK